MDFAGMAEALKKVFEVLLTISKWLNGNIFSNTGSVVDGLKKVIDFISGLFKDGGFLSGLFSGDGFSLGGIGDFFKGLF